MIRLTNDIATSSQTLSAQLNSAANNSIVTIDTEADLANVSADVNVVFIADKKKLRTRKLAGTGADKW